MPLFNAQAAFGAAVHGYPGQRMDRLIAEPTVDVEVVVCKARARTVKRRMTETVSVRARSA